MKMKWKRTEHKINMKWNEQSYENELNMKWKGNKIKWNENEMKIKWQE